MLSTEATGRTIEQAIENALFELKAPREDVDIKIIDEGGLFRKAKVLVSISEDEIEKYQKREQRREASQELTKNDDEEQPLKQDDALDNDEQDKDEEDETTESTSESEENVPSNDTSVPSDDLNKAKTFIEGVLKRASLTGSVELTENNDEIYANISGYSDIIGYRGEGLNALQYLTSVVTGKHNRHSKRVRIDCDNYRSKREASLVALAQRMAKKVERTHSSVKLEPMTANERRIIHTALAESETVETFSKGEEPHRYLIIKPKDQK